MAYIYNILRFQAGDKVIAGSDVFDNDEENEIKYGQVVTIKDEEVDSFNSEMQTFTFEEIDGEWGSGEFYLHKDSLVDMSDTITLEMCYGWEDDE